MYKSRCVSAVVYGADVWGYKNLKVIQREENRFFRRILCLPSSLPHYKLHDELGLVYISNLLAIRPLSMAVDPEAGGKQIKQDNNKGLPGAGQV